ncbi:MAG: ABC-2 family transporter protein [Candidatus Nanoarchaeia archaeon]|nr:ABC-2 family transporter protein [Candidatus Nanoarchaeia archaeon]
MINKYSEFFKMEIKEDLADRSRFILWIISKPISMMINILIWTAIFSNSNSLSIGGFSIGQTINYFLFQAVFGNIIFNNISEKIGAKIYSGELSTSLLKPVNFSISMVSKSLGGRFFSLIYESIPTHAIAMLFFGMQIYNKPAIILSIISLFLGLLINCFFSLSWSLLYFKTLNYMPLERIKRFVIQFISGFYLPLNFFPLALQNVLKFLPFNFLLYEPTKIFLNIYSFKEILGVMLIQIVWIIVLYGTFNFFFKITLKKFEGVGA